jgi:TRAP-type C4-dicarboxylate transport system permease small subunit
VFGVGFLWGDPLVRQMVLWSGFMGAALATHHNRHISIDALSKYLPVRLKALVGVVTSLFGAVVCWYLASAARTFLLEEKEAGADMVFSLPAWIGLVIVPAGYGLIALHFLLISFELSVIAAGRGKAEEAS